MRCTCVRHVYVLSNFWFRMGWGYCVVRVLHCEKERGVKSVASPEAGQKQEWDTANVFYYSPNPQIPQTARFIHQKCGRKGKAIFKRGSRKPTKKIACELLLLPPCVMNDENGHVIKPNGYHPRHVNQP